VVNSLQNPSKKKKESLNEKGGGGRKKEGKKRKVDCRKPHFVCLLFPQRKRGKKKEEEGSPKTNPAHPTTSEKGAAWWSISFRLRRGKEGKQGEKKEGKGGKNSLPLSRHLYARRRRSAKGQGRGKEEKRKEGGAQQGTNFLPTGSWLAHHKGRKKGNKGRRRRSASAPTHFFFTVETDQSGLELRSRRKDKKMGGEEGMDRGSTAERKP